MRPLAHRWRGRLLAAAVGLGLVGGLEALLHLVPAFAPPPLVVTLVSDGAGHSLRQLNPAYPRRFFAGSVGGFDLGGVSLSPHRFLDPPPDGALRVAVVGASTVQGYPHPARLAFPALLGTLLGNALQRPVQTINLGITSLASFAVARVVADAIADLAPDLVVVDTGHNEFYGVYGTAALRQGGPWPWLRHLHYRLLQLRLAALVRWLASPLRRQAGDDLSLLAAMGSVGPVPAQDPARARAVAQLRASLEEIADLCRRRAVPLVLCVPAANEAGFAPDTSSAGLPDAGRERWQRLRARVADLVDQGTPAGAREALALLAQAPPGLAEALFLQGRALAASGETAAARAAFAAARDADPAPWRAPTPLLAVVRDVARSRRVALADAERRLAGAAPDSLVGWDLMVDHVHPTARGHALVSRSVVDALVGAPPPWTVAPDWEVRAPTDAQLLALHGDLPVEAVALARAVAALLERPPLRQERQAAQVSAEADRRWGQLGPEAQAGFTAWVGLGRRPPLVLPVADNLFAAKQFGLAAQHYGAARMEAPLTPWGDLWPTLRRGRCLLYLQDGRLTAPQRREIEEAVQRAALVIGVAGADPDFGPTFHDYARRLLAAPVAGT